MIAALAKKHQNDGQLQPLSMVTMYTPASVGASSTEKHFRRRAIQLGEQYTSDVSCEEALIAIMDTLLKEGLAMFQDLEDIVNIIEDQLRLNKRSE